MKFSKSSCIVLFAVLAIATQVSAQGNLQSPAHHQQYKLTQVGTFGGPDSNYVTGPAFTDENYFNPQGATVGFAATNVADPFPYCFFDCFVSHALRFQDGTLTDLGALPGNSGNNSSTSYGINASGLIVGVSENGSIDPSTGYPEYHAVVWRGGVLTDLGTFEGSVSQAFAVNNRGQVVGVAANAVPDDFASGLGPCTTFNCWPVTTQQRAFLWEGGSLQDLGTLGTGNDAVAYYVNEGGQVAGVSYTNTTPNPTTGVPTQHPFLWERGRMTDLGTLGGTVGIVYAPLNNRGQVAGYSTLPGDQFYHAFLWDRGALKDLGTLGGTFSYATWLNDSGDVVGGAQTGSQAVHAFLWRHGGMTDLGILAGEEDSFAEAINAAGQIVGGTYTSQGGPYKAFLWEEGGPMVDLNTLVTPPSNLNLEYGIEIADGGEILAFGRLPNGDIRIAVLTPHGH